MNINILKTNMIDLDYQVVKLLYKSSEPMKVGDIARALKFPHSTIGSCVKRLENEDLVSYNRYKLVLLTEGGKNLAAELIRHSRLLEVLLHEALGLSNEVAHVESEKFNLLFSCETINRICEKYGHPKQCPCGHEITNSPECCCEGSKTL